MNCGSESNNLLELASSEFNCGRPAAVRTGCYCCQETELVRSLPGLSHATYGWMLRGSRSSFFEVLYADNQSNGEFSSQSESLTINSCRSCTAEEKLGTAAKGLVSLKRCNKWPFHSSLTLVCDSRPSHTVARVKAMKNVQKLDKNAGAELKLVRRCCKESV